MINRIIFFYNPHFYYYFFKFIWKIKFWEILIFCILYNLSIRAYYFETSYSFYSFPVISEFLSFKIFYFLKWKSKGFIISFVIWKVIIFFFSLRINKYAAYRIVVFFISFNNTIIYFFIVIGYCIFIEFFLSY